MKNNQQNTEESLVPSSFDRNEKEESFISRLTSQNNFYKESLVALVLGIILVLILNPAHFWMPSMAHVSMLLALLGVFGFYASYILREVAVDERDVLHRMFASRAAYLAGTSLLIVGILYGAIRDDVNIWLIATLMVMIVTKLLARLYSDRNL